jgi:endonuclease YncB( thermonuclease family)
MMKRSWYILIIFGWLATACKPVTPTLPPTWTPTRTIVRPTPAAPAPVLTATVGPAEQSPEASQPALAPSPSPTLLPTPTVNPLACLPDDTGETGLVSWVNDGETLVVDFAGRVKTVQLLGVTAPPMGKDTLRSLLERRVVRLVPDGPDTDEQGRLLRYVQLLDGRFINDDLLRSGTARLNSNIIGRSCMAQFDAAEAFAIDQGLGIWNVAARAALPTELQGTAPAILPMTQTVGGEASLSTPTLTFTPPAALATSSPGTPTTTTQISPSNTPGGSSSNPTSRPQQPGPPPSATATLPQPTSQSPASGVQIVNIFYQGVKSESEPDEYIEIKNFDSSPVDISYWLINAETNELWYIFPEFTIQAGQTCRIYTNEINSDSCVDDSFLMAIDNYQVWDNTADCGYLYNYADINEVSKFCYGQ